MNRDTQPVAKPNVMMGYIIAIVATALMVIVRLILASTLGQDVPMLLFVVAVVAAAWYGGFGPGLLATILSTAMGGWLFIEWGSANIGNVPHQLRLIIFSIVGVLISGLSEVLHQQRRRVEEGRNFALSIVDTIGEPLIVLDRNLRVNHLNKSFTEAFNVRDDVAVNRSIYEIAEGQWNLPAIHKLLDELLPAQTEVEDYLIEHDFPGIGFRILRLDARRLYRPENEAPLLLLAIRDYTQRELAERAITKQRELLRVTLESVGDAVVTTDVNGRVTFLNRVAQQLTGWSQDAAAGQPLASVFHIVNEATRQIVDNPATRALREGVVVGLANHTVLISKDGSERPIDDSAAPIRDESGHVSGCVLIFRDITERQRAARVLQESESRKTAMFETTLDAIVSIDQHDAIIEFNASAEKMFGWERKVVLGKTMAEVIIPVAYRGRHRQGMIRYLATGEGPVLNKRLELSALRANGSEFPVELTVTRIPIAGPPQFTAYLRDLSDRNLASDQLRESEQRFRILFELGPVAVFSCDRNGIVQNYNRRAAELWGREPKCGDVNERYCGSMKLILPDGTHLPHTSSPMVEVLRTGNAVRDVEVFIERPDGSRIAVIVTFVALVINGETTGAITAFYDITDRKRLENELRQTASELSEADRRKNEFLAMLAHELRNPLAPIRNALQIMKLTDGLSPTIKSASEMMERQVGQMVRLVDDLLDISRVSRGKIELRRERIELASAVHHAVEAARPLCKSLEHDFTVELPNEPIYLYADQTRIAQIVGNLLNNACKFTPRGGRVILSVERETEHAVIRIRDTGVGIASDQISRIFEMFTQVDTTLERSVSGLGIGLTLVKNLVEMHGGSVQAISPGLGHGSEFVIRLPRVHEAPIARAEIVSPENPARISHRILVVDDNKDSATTLALLLKLKGHETHTAHDGIAAVEATESFRPNVVLLDIGLPKLNGYEAARKIRGEEWGKSIVLVALTGWGQEEDLQHSKEAGFDSHLVKPVDHAVLIKVLNELVPEGV